MTDYTHKRKHPKQQKKIMCGGDSPCYAEVWQGTFQVGNNDFKIKVTDFEDEDEGEKHFFSMEDE